MKLIALTVAAMLAAAPAPLEPRPRPIVQAAAMVGVGSLAMGIAFEITGLSGLEPHGSARASAAGGAALLGLGVCLIAIAVLLTPWEKPPVALWLGPDGGVVVVRVPWP